MIHDYAFWIIVIGTPVILLADLVIKLLGHETISVKVWKWSATSWGRLIPFALGFLICHLLLGRSGNG